MIKTILFPMLGKFDSFTFKLYQLLRETNKISPNTSHIFAATNMKRICPWHVMKKIGDFYLEEERASHLKIQVKAQVIFEDLYKEARDREETIKRQHLVSY